MSSFSDFTDKIPVKISENFKPPPRIEIDRDAVEAEFKARHALDVVGYDFTFEETVLNKISSLRSARETARNERQHRWRLLEEAKQRKIDEHNAAVETAERIRQLSIAHVTYPSTDDMTQGAPTEGEQAGVLRPVRLPPPSLTHPLDSDVLSELRLSTPRLQPLPHRDLAHLSVADFEHDTSSPFDEVELQSIDAYEQLAQVLHPPVTNVPEQNTHENQILVEPVENQMLSEPVMYGYYSSPMSMHSYNYIPQTMPVIPVHVRGVTDIVNELAQEVSLQQEKAQRELALASMPPRLPPPHVSPSSSPAARTERQPDLYDDLTPSLQELCRRVQGMGFPRERVARVVSLLGDCDKVIEGVLLVGQLLDLGFPENRVAAALEKHHFNRDKALEDLIA